MDNDTFEFFLPNVDGSGGIRFFDREPFDCAVPITSFWVHISAHKLTATAEVYAGCAPSHPAGLFAKLAEQSSGWSGELAWKSLEGELEMDCRHDGLGHISICIGLRSGHYDRDWRVTAMVLTEAGQLESIAKRAALFFGLES